MAIEEVLARIDSDIDLYQSIIDSSPHASMIQTGMIIGGIDLLLAGSYALLTMARPDIIGPFDPNKLAFALPPAGVAAANILGGFKQHKDYRVDENMNVVSYLTSLKDLITLYTTDDITQVRVLEQDVMDKFKALPPDRKFIESGRIMEALEDGLYRTDLLITIGTYAWNSVLDDIPVPDMVKAMAGDSRFGLGETGLRYLIEDYAASDGPEKVKLIKETYSRLAPVYQAQMRSSIYRFDNQNK